jgi:hypothetical protein
MQILTRPHTLCASVVLSLAALSGGCSDAGTAVTELRGGPAPRAGATPPAGVTPSPGAALRVADEPLAEYRGELLDIAFGAVSRMPLDPHVKNRGRAQEQVIAACLELGQPVRALAYIEQVPNWRQGAAYADLAAHIAARAGDGDDVQLYLRRARELVETCDEENFDGWRRDRVRVRIARTYLLLGQPDEASRFQENLEISEAEDAVDAQAALIPADELDGHIASLDALIESESFEHIVYALSTYVQLFDRFYDDVERREQFAERVLQRGKVAREKRLELMMGLANAALEHDDSGAARGILDSAYGVLEDAAWNAESKIPLMARLAELRFRAGEEVAARELANCASQLFLGQYETIIDMYRGAVLRPLAEAFEALGDRASALTTYALAVEEGVKNPNSRPRSIDLAETCCSLALRGVEPDEALWLRLREIQAGLGDPW